MWEWDAGNLMRGSLRYTLYLFMIIILQQQQKRKKRKIFRNLVCFLGFYINVDPIFNLVNLILKFTKRF